MERFWLLSTLKAWLILYLVGYSYSAAAQKILQNSQSVATTKCHSYELTTFKQIRADSITTEGIIVRGKFVKCEVTVDDTCYYIKFDRYQDHCANLTFTCTASQSDKLFNGHYKGLRVGIWFCWSFWGKLTKAIFYNEHGELEKEILFWRNGNVKRVIAYRFGKPWSSGGCVYSKDGNSLSSPPGMR